MNTPALDHDSLQPPEPGPLNGIRVLDIATVYAAPITAMLLGDYGADVLKIEHPRGDPARTHGHSKDGYGLWWKVLARNKRAVTLNLSHPASRELLEQLAADADVLIENFRPGVMEKWGLGPDRLHEINPALVMLRVTGFGQFGPYATRRAFGTLAEAMTGFAHQTGQPDGPPTLPPFGLADGVAGLAGAIAVMLALYHRERNGGRGQVIDVSLIEPLLTILGPGPSVFDQLQVVPGRHGNRSPSNAPRNTYLTRDGRWVAVSTSATPVAERVMRLVGRPDIAEKPWFQSARERVHHGDQLDSILGGWIRARDFDDVMAAFDLAGAAIAPIYDVEQLMEDPQVKAIDAITTIKDEDLGPLKMQNVMFRLSQSPGSIRFTGRRLGQDNEQVYGEARPGSGPDRRAAGGRSDLMHRSYLFAPGHNAKLLRRVFEAGADAVILDLEDAVPPDAKQQARLMVAGVLAERSAWVRINTVRTDLAAADLDAVAGLAAGIRIPKAESAGRRAVGPRPRPRHAADLRDRERPGAARRPGDRDRPRCPVPVHGRRGPATRPRRRRRQPADAVRALAHRRGLARRRPRAPGRQRLPAPRRRPGAAPAGRVRPLARLLRQVRDPSTAARHHPRRVHAI